MTVGIRRRLTRAYDGSFRDLAAAVARLAAAPPRASVEQLETLAAAMPTRDERRAVVARVDDGLARASALALESITGRRPAWDIFKPLYLAQIELVFHDS